MNEAIKYLFDNLELFFVISIAAACVGSLKNAATKKADQGNG